MNLSFTRWESWAISAGILILVIIGSVIVHRVVFAILVRVAARPDRVLDASLLRHGRKPSRWIFPLLGLLIAVPLVPLPSQWKTVIEHAVGLGLIAAFAWGCILLTSVTADIFAARYPVDVEDNLAARRIQTQVQVLRRVVTVVVVTVALAIMLLTIPQVRAVGASLLASAGLAGLVLGVAMRPTLSNLVAGVQIAITQPIRLEDAVIVENEWGWVEEINMTYVVVRLWDWRRIVLPISYFVEHSFQNWTRTTSNLLGSVYLYVDYSVPVDALRSELTRLVKSTDKWDGNVCVLQVSDAREHTVELRALADARDAGTAWDLRCYLREHLIKFVQEKYPESLPRTRAALSPLPLQPAEA